MKDLGKTSSTDSTESVSFHTEKSSDSTSGVDVNDDVCQLTDEIVDKHLADLKHKCLSSETRDVAKFMEKLKNQSESVDESTDGAADAAKKVRRESESKKELETVPKVKSEKSDENHLQVKLTKKSSLSPQGSIKKPKTIDLDSYPPQPSAESQVQIVKIRSPRMSRENSRNSSTERSPSRERQSSASSLKKPEQAGILKKPSPKFGKASENRFSNSLRPDSFISPFSSFESKSDKMSPSSEILPSNFVRESKQRASFSDYERELQQQQLKELQQQQLQTQHHYHQAAMKSRSLESSLELLKPAIKQQSSYEYASPSHHCDPMKFYSLSSQPSIESNRSPIRYYSPIPPHQPFYEQPFHEYPLSQHLQHQQQQHHGKPRRESRSLERPQFSRQSSSELERERFYQDDTAYNRRHSYYGEHRSIPQQFYSTSSPDDFLMPHYEQPSACVDCYYQTHRRNLYQQPPQQQQQPPPLPQRNASQPQQKSPSATMKRQSRSRKKLSRRMSSNYFNKSFDDDGVAGMQQFNASAACKQLSDNEEIRV